MKSRGLLLALCSAVLTAQLSGCAATTGTSQSEPPKQKIAETPEADPEVTPYAAVMLDGFRITPPQEIPITDHEKSGYYQAYAVLMNGP